MCVCYVHINTDLPPVHVVCPPSLSAAWLADPEMPLIVDEIFVELHYKHPSLSQYHWMQFNHTRADATRLFNRLRAAGFFVHPWP